MYKLDGLFFSLELIEYIIEKLTKIKNNENRERLPKVSHLTFRDSSTRLGVAGSTVISKYRGKHHRHIEHHRNSLNPQ